MTDNTLLLSNLENHRILALWHNANGVFEQEHFRKELYAQFPVFEKILFPTRVGDSYDLETTMLQYVRDRQNIVTDQQKMEAYFAQQKRITQHNVGKMMPAEQAKEADLSLAYMHANYSIEAAKRTLLALDELSQRIGSSVEEICNDEALRNRVWQKVYVTQERAVIQCRTEIESYTATARALFAHERMLDAFGVGENSPVRISFIPPEPHTALQYQKMATQYQTSRIASIMGDSLETL